MSTHSAHEAGPVPLARSVTPELLPAVPAPFPPGYRLPVDCTDPDLIQRYVATQMGRTVEACLEMGRGLVALKALCPHGNFLVRLRTLGIGTPSATRFMAAFRRLSNATLTPLLSAVGNQSKLFELLPLDDGQLEALARKEKVGPLVLSDIPPMATKVLREAVRRCRDEAGQGAAALQPADRIESHLAKRPGSVVKVYPDGSACVLWDDGEPQPEGMGHERVPRDCLVLRASANAPPPDLEGDEAGEPEAFGHDGNADSNPHLVKAMPHGSKPEPETLQAAERAGAADALARRKAYLEARMRTLLRFAEGAELNILDDALDDLVGDITRARFVPGLVAEDYALTHRFLVAGGVQ
ncbi:hypothetical protein [Zoogloea sp.]|uniref:hypothetical protein n=1 Tax=Zoogloea sp. TaxID=49181 RepID=UPI0035AEF603